MKQFHWSFYRKSCNKFNEIVRWRRNKVKIIFNLIGKLHQPKKEVKPGLCDSKQHSRLSWGYLTIIRFPFFCLFTLPVLSLLPLVCLFIYFCWVSFFAFSFLSPHLFHLHLLPCIRLLCFHSIISLNFTASLFPFHLTIFLLFLLFNLDFFFFARFQFIIRSFSLWKFIESSALFN